MPHAERYVNYFLNSRSSAVLYELVEISHVSFTKTYRIIRNCGGGLTVRIGGEDVKFEYYPLRIERNDDKGDLDQSFRFILGDIGEILPNEISRVMSSGSSSIKPKVIYYAFSSTDLGNPLFGPFELEMEYISFNHEGSTFVARAPEMNVSQTGENYSLDRFPMLKPFLT